LLRHEAGGKNRAFAAANAGAVSKKSLAIFSNGPGEMT
jgi:hypothetical protein